MRKSLVLMVGLVLMAGSAQGFTFTSVGPSVYTSDTAAMDAALGLTGLAIEDFEDTDLIQGLSVSWGSSTPVSVLGSLASFPGPVSEWDGTSILDNRLNHIPSNPPETFMTFYVSPGSTIFGFGLSQAEERRNPDHRILVNGIELIPDIGDLPGYLDNGLANSEGHSRNLYLIIEAEAGELIQSVQIDQGPVSPGFGIDGIHFDHVAMNVVPEPNTALLLGFGLVGLGMKRRRGSSHSGDERVSSC